MTDGQLPDGPSVSHGAERWVNFADLAERRGISKAAASKLVRRHKWRRQTDNQGRVLILVPVDALDRPTGRSTGRPSPLDAMVPAVGPMDRTDMPAIVTGALTTLEAAITLLREQLDGANARTDAAIEIADRATRMASDADAHAGRAEAALAGERQRADALRERIDAMLAQIAAAEAAAEALRVERDQAQREAQEAAAWRVRGLLARLRTAWRGE